METTLPAEVRTGSFGKGTARKLRATGRIPAVVYGRGEDALHVHVSPAALSDIFRKSGDRNTVVRLQLDGNEIPCLVKDVQRHPLTRSLLHVDFFKVSSERKVEVMVRLNPIGRAVGMSLGGRLRLVRRAVLCRCDWEKIPPSIDHDITQMGIEDMVKVSELAAPDGVEIVFDSDFNVLHLYGKRAAPDLGEGLEGEGEEAAGEEAEGDGDGAEDEG